MSLIHFRLRLIYKRAVKKNKEKCLEKVVSIMVKAR